MFIGLLHLGDCGYISPDPRRSPSATRAGASRCVRAPGSARPDDHLPLLRGAPLVRPVALHLDLHTEAEQRVFDVLLAEAIAESVAAVRLGPERLAHGVPATGLEPHLELDQL